jgi:hypothetical protein
MESPFEHLLLNTYKNGLIGYMRSHPEAFGEALKLSLSNNQPYSWRAAWLLWSVITKNDPRIKPYILEIIRVLPLYEDNQQRELMKILLMMDISTKHEGILFHECLKIWEKPHKQPSVRINALRLIVRIVKNHPDLALEIRQYFQDPYLDNLSYAAKRVVMKLTKEF